MDLQIYNKKCIIELWEMNMKKIFRILLCTILVISLMGCGGSKKEENGESSGTNNSLESKFLGEWTGKDNTGREVKWKFESGGKASYSEYLDSLSEPKWINASATWEVIDEDTIHIQVHNAYNHIGEFQYEFNGDELKINYVKTLNISEEEQKYIGFKSFTLTREE